MLGFGGMDGVESVTIVNWVCVSGQVRMMGWVRVMATWIGGGWGRGRWVGGSSLEGGAGLMLVASIMLEMAAEGWYEMCALAVEKWWRGRR